MLMSKAVLPQRFADGSPVTASFFVDCIFVRDDELHLDRTVSHAALSSRCWVDMLPVDMLPVLAEVLH